MIKHDSNHRDTFTSRFGVIAAAAGSAVGLGNVWRFPYVLGESGGAAFLLTYLLIIFAFGVPVMMSELLIGRLAQRNVIGAFKQLAPGKPWYLIGVMGVGAAFLIISFYSVIGGWTLEYLYSSIVRTFGGMDNVSAGAEFTHLKTSPLSSSFWMVVFMGLTAAIVLGGVKEGIEKYSKILMPMLFVIMILLVIRALTLPNAAEGLKFLFYPDFSKLTADVIFKALGQAFFSLSIGMGVMATYGSYIGQKEKLGTTAFSVCLTDTSVAVLAGMVIFPAAFAFGIKPESGPDLVFITLPGIFDQMFMGHVFSALFFALLAIAALTSSISLLEVVVAYFTEELKLKRKTATVVAATAMVVLGVLCARFSAVFNAFDGISSNILLPLGGVLIVVFVAWILGKQKAREALEPAGQRIKLFNYFWFAVKFLAPIVIGYIFVQGVLSFFAK